MTNKSYVQESVIRLILYLPSICFVLVQVGFASLALEVLSIELGACEAKVTRTGLFGEVSVQWKAGYPSGMNPQGFRIGRIIPNTGETL